MAAQASSATEQPQSGGHSGKSNIVVVDLGTPQSSKAVDRLRKGKGKLFDQVDQIVKDLVQDGTVKGNAQPVVIVVRESPLPPWLLGQED